MILIKTHPVENNIGVVFNFKALFGVILNSCHSNRATILARFLLIVNTAYLESNMLWLRLIKFYINAIIVPHRSSYRFIVFFYFVSIFFEFQITGIIAIFLNTNLIRLGPITTVHYNGFPIGYLE